MIVFLNFIEEWIRNGICFGFIKLFENDFVLKFNVEFFKFLLLILLLLYK